MQADGDEQNRRLLESNMAIETHSSKLQSELEGCTDCLKFYKTKYEDLLITCTDSLFFGAKDTGDDLRAMLEKKIQAICDNTITLSL
jgi:hypothetical protein